ncbi:MAG: hypothetical protein SCM11_09675 [Bacillota bacterium]|nr:hypothetical protein [Bacillota bacterium]
MNTFPSRRSNPLSFSLLIFVMLVALVPALYSFILSLIDYSPIHGLFGSPFAGLRNYADVIGGSVFFRLLTNSFLLWLISLAASLLLAVPVALLCSQIKSRKTAATCAGLLLIPVFIPSSAYFTVIFKLFSSRVFAQSSLYYFGFAAQTFLPGAALIAFAGVVVGFLYRSAGKNAMNGSLVGCLVAALLFAFQSLSPAYEASMLSANPLVYNVADTFDNHNYRNALLQMQIGTGAANYVIRSILQLLLAIIPVILMVILLRRKEQLQPVVAEDAITRTPGSIVAWVLAVVLAVLFLFAAGLPSFTQVSAVADRILPSMVITVFAAIIGMGISCLLLFGAAGSGRTVVTIVAAIILGSGNALFAQYMLARQFGLINTFLATPLTQWLQPAVLLLLFLFALIVRMDRSQTTAVLLACAAALFIGAMAYGGFVPQVVFASGPQQFTMGVAFRNAISGPAGGDSGLMALVFMFNVLPCLLMGFGAAVLVRLGLLKAAA